MPRARLDIPWAVRREVLSTRTCAYCGDRYGPFEVEHVRPVSRGGGDERANLACACEACNSQKRAMLLHEWISWCVTNGMPWPPIAQHATEPEHYQDDCTACDSAASRITFVPRELRTDPTGGYVGAYRGSFGHAWKCWWGVSPFAYPDCSCGFCASVRLEMDGPRPVVGSPS